MFNHRQWFCDSEWCDGCISDNLYCSSCNCTCTQSYTNIYNMFYCTCIQLNDESLQHVSLQVHQIIPNLNSRKSTCVHLCQVLMSNSNSSSPTVRTWAPNNSTLWPSGLAALVLARIYGKLHVGCTASSRVDMLKTNQLFYRKSWNAWFRPRKQ